MSDFTFFNRCDTNHLRLVTEPVKQRCFGEFSSPEQCYWTEMSPLASGAEVLLLLLQQVTGQQTFQNELVRCPAARVPGVSGQPYRINTPATGSNELPPVAADS